jgi:hypothetical protein
MMVACSPDDPVVPVTVDRKRLIPEGQIKITKENDIYPVRSESEDYEDPVPLPYPVNTAGAEDSAFIMPDGKTLYIWFTPDVNNPVQNQAVDGVTGIYVSYQMNGSWTEPERVYLEQPGKAVLDGCAFVLDDTMWFCTAREGLTGIHWFTAKHVDGIWTEWKITNFDPDHKVGELHITSDGSVLYYHSDRQGGAGGYDIWVSKLVDGEWGPPENLVAVNSEYSDGWPFVSEDGTELWFTRSVGAPELYRSIRKNGEWTEPVKMFSAFSGEASLDLEGNVYFTHHYYKDDKMLEADIFIARKK